MQFTNVWIANKARKLLNHQHSENSFKFLENAVMRFIFIVSSFCLASALSLQTRHTSERTASSTDHQSNVDSCDAASEGTSVARYVGDGSLDFSAESPLPCRSAGSSSDGVFFASNRRDNRRYISKSQMKGI